MRALEKALKHSLATNGERHPNTANLYNQLGNTHFRQGQLEPAIASYKLAVQVSDAGEHLTAAFSNLGTCYWKSGQTAEAIHMLKQALAVHELDLEQQGRSVHESLQAASIYHQLGVGHCLASDHTNALACLEQARAIRVRVAPSAVGPTLDAIGKVYLMQDKLDEAMTCHQQALQSLRAAGVANPASTLQNIANVHLQAGNPSAALAVLQEVYKLQRAAGLNTPSKLALHRQTVMIMAKLYEETGNPDEAERLRAECR